MHVQYIRVVFSEHTVYLKHIMCQHIMYEYITFIMLNSNVDPSYSPPHTLHTPPQSAVSTASSTHEAWVYPLNSAS